MRTLVLRGGAVDLDTGEVSGDCPGRLTTRELTLLAYLVDRRDEPVPRHTLLTEAFGYSDAATSRAVDKAMNSLRAKVERDPAEPDHLITVVGTGYRFVGGSATPAVEPNQRLPAEVDAFVGRTAALGEVRALLGSPGLVILVGPGGIGKTRLALAVARDAAGSRWVSLAGARSRDDMLGAVAASLGVPLSVPGVPADQQLGRAIAALGPRIVVLDNLEHLAGHADLVDLWRRLAPDARLLATSRQSLGLAGERLYRVDPMPVDEATELLVRRAAQRGFAVPVDEDLGELARRLDGLPLALELAGARLGGLGVRELLGRVDDRLSLLRSRDPTAPTRHATLGAMLDWSWSLLDGAERTAMAELSVFPTDFTADAAEAVLQRSADGSEPLDAVDRLLDASLLHRRTVEGAVRLGMLETVRIYAAERLAALDPSARRRAETAHAAHYSRLGEALRDGLGPDGAAGIRRLARELDHLAVACRRSVAADDPAAALTTLRSCAALCHSRGPHFLYVALAREVSAMVSLSARQRAEATWDLGKAVARITGEEAIALLERTLAQAVELGDPGLADRARISLGTVLNDRGQRDEARACFVRCLESADPVIRSSARRHLAVLVHTSGAYEEALHEFAQAEDEARRAGDLLLAAIARNNAVWTAIRLNRLALAEGMLEDCRQVFEAFDAKVGLLHAQATLGQILGLRGDAERSIQLLREAAAGFRVIGDNKSLMVVVGETGGLLCRDGRWDEALACFVEAEAVAHDLGDLRGIGALGAGRAQVLVGLGRVGEALALVAEVRDTLRPMGVTDISLSVDLVVADTLVAAGRREEALRVLDEVERSLGGLGHGPTTELGVELGRIRSAIG